LPFDEVVDIVIVRIGAERLREDLGDVGAQRVPDWDDDVAPIFGV
jgi:hypothetical protein